MRRAAGFAVLILSFALAACDAGKPTDEIACPANLRPSVIVTVRDDTGKAAAIGTTLTLVGATDVVNKGAPLKGFADSLTMLAGGNMVAGPMDVELTKPWYNATGIRGLKMTVNQCGVILPAQIGVTLKLKAGAPPVRQVVVEPTPRTYSRAGITDSPRVVVLADDSVSHEVRWSSGDESVATISSDGLVTSRCRKAPGNTWVYASAVANPSV